jgi:hypothetical protein
MTKHTSGEWKYRQSYIDGEPQGYVIYSGATEIAQCLLGIDPDQDEADARVLAAAPRMLNALEELIAWADYMGGFESPQWEQARAALAKATGKQ